MHHQLPGDASIETEKTYSADGTLQRKKSVLKFETADRALAMVFVLCLILFVMSLFVDSMREGLDGALPALLGVFTAAVGGIEAFKIFRNTT
jgi:hypothetical protein